MSRLFDLVGPECGKTMEINQEVDLTPRTDLVIYNRASRNESNTGDVKGIRKILRQAGNGDDFPNAGDKIKIKYNAYKGDEIEPEYLFETKEIEYEVCKGKVLRGFELAILTMRVGEHAEIYLTPEYGYGKAGAPPEIPPDTPVIFDVTLLDIQCPDLSRASDRSILKKTLIRGKGWREPNEGCMMKIHMKGCYTGENGQDVVFVDKDVYFPYGEGSYEKYDVPNFVENYLNHWKKKETARLFLKSHQGYGEIGNARLGIPPNTDLTYVIEMKDFEKDKDIWEMNNEEKLDTCEQLREKGNFYFKESNMTLANKFYQRIVEIVGNDLCMQGEEEKRRQDILCKGFLNLAQVSLNKKNYRLAKDLCDKTLDLDGQGANVKALYRRGMASFNLQDWDAAKKDFEKVVEIEPGNKAAKKQIVECQNKAKQSAGQEKELAQKMFSGLGKGPDDRLMYASGMNDIDEWNNRMAQGMMTLEEEQAAFGETLPERGGNNHGIEH